MLKERLICLVLIIIISLITISIGKIILKLIRVKIENDSEELILANAFGLIFLSFFTFILGIFHLYKPLYFQLFILVSFIFLFRQNLTALKAVLIKLTGAVKGIKNFAETKFEKIIIIIFILFLLLQLLAGFIPPTGIDVLKYHFLIVKEYIKRGGIEYIPYIVEANLNPQNIYMLYLFGIIIYTDILGNLINTYFSVLLYSSLIILGLKIFNKKITLYSLLIFSFTPFTDYLVTTAYLECAIAFFTITSFICFINWVKTHNLKFLYIISVFIGFLFGCKYTALPLGLIFIVALIMTCYKQKYPYSKIIKDVILHSILIFIIASPWYIKNYIFTGNPIWPYFFGGKYLIPASEVKLPYDIFDINTIKFFSVVLFIAFNINMLNYKYSSLLLTLLPLSLLSLFIKDKPLLIKIFLLICIIFLLYNYIFGVFDARYWFLFYPIFCFVLSYTFLDIANRGKYLKLVLFIVLSLNIILLCYIRITWTIDYLSYNTRKELYSKTTREFEVMEFINKNLNKNVKILSIGWHNYFLERESIITLLYQGYINFLEINKEKFKERLKELKITHLLYDKEYVNFFSLLPEEEVFLPEDGRCARNIKSIVEDLIEERKLKKIYEKNNIILYEIIINKL